MSIKQKADELYRLHQQEVEMQKADQSVRNEYELTELRLKKKILESEIECAVASRTLVLIAAFFKTGRMTAIRDDGTRMDSDPVVTGRDIQDYWNGRGEAERLARWSLGL